ncbi:MAG TPA: carbohydrate kinase family protein [Patescibacteria group bacterium]|nr:carbohydrate kinase family protein [Patescibacteria group bacterium]
MRFNVVTFGSAFVDVYLSSPEFKIVKSKDSPTGVAICEVYGAKINVKKMVMTTGGGATNVAVALERLGLQTGCVCRVGNDDWGLFVRKELRKEGVSPLYVQVDDSAPTSYSTMLVSEAGGRSALVYRGASSQLSWHQVAWDKLEGDWFYVSSLGGDLAMLTKIIRTAQSKKIKVAFNPGSAEIGAGDRLKAFLPQIDLLILNRLEASQLTGNKFTNLKSILANIGKLGANLVAVTEGAKGAYLIRGKGQIKLPAFKVKMAEETGAGDAFGAGLLAGLIKDMGLEEALRLGMANGAAVTTQFGPKAGLLFAPEVSSWLK